MEDTQKTEAGKTQEPKNVEDGEHSTPIKEETTFTQDEVNSIVTGRLKKEREKYSDYDSLKTQASELEEIKIKYDDLTAKDKVNEDTLGEVYTSLTEGIEEDKKSLIPDQLSLVEKIKYVSRNNKVFATKVIVKTPEPEDKSKGEAGLYGGKYKTVQDWAQHDPVGYLKWRKTQ